MCAKKMAERLYFTRVRWLHWTNSQCDTQSASIPKKLHEFFPRNHSVFRISVSQTEHMALDPRSCR